MSENRSSMKNFWNAMHGSAREGRGQGVLRYAAEAGAEHEGGDAVQGQLPQQQGIDGKWRKNVQSIS